jgi:hypothetical protein
MALNTGDWVVATSQEIRDLMASETCDWARETASRRKKGPRIPAKIKRKKKKDVAKPPSSVKPRRPKPKGKKDAEKVEDVEDEKQITKETKECAICYLTLGEAMEVKNASGVCPHAFHYHCIFAWKQQSRGTKTPCPLCKRDFIFKDHREQRITDNQTRLNVLATIKINIIATDGQVPNSNCDSCFTSVADSCTFCAESGAWCSMVHWGKCGCMIHECCLTKDLHLATHECNTHGVDWETVRITRKQ